MTPVTIGAEKYIKDPNKGWIDSKTKQPADKGLIRLLDSLVIDEPLQKKLKVKIDKTIDPISIHGQKYVYDTNQGWIDEKTKVPAPESLQRTLSNAVPRFGKDDTADIDLTAGFGMTGTAGLQKTKAKTVKEPKAPKTGGGTLIRNRNTAINKPLIAMINQLASIDGYLKQQLQNKQIVASKELAQAKEANIEAKGEDISQQLEDTQPDAEKENNESNIAGAAALAAVIALQFDPVKDTLKQLVDYGISVGSFVINVAKTINTAFDWLLDNNSSGGEIPPNWQTSGPDTSGTLSANPRVREAAFAADRIQSNKIDKTPKYFANSPLKPEIKKPSGSILMNPTTSTTSSTFTTPSTPVITVPTTSSSTPTPSLTSTVKYATSTTKPATTKPALMTKAAQDKPAVKQTASTGKQDATKVSQPGVIPKNDIVGLGKYLQSQGIKVSEHPSFGHVGEHSPNSRHYRGQAIDLNIVGGNDADDPVAAAKFDALKPQLEAAGYNVLWRSAGHYNHMHVSVGGPEGVGGFGGGESPMAGIVDTVSSTLETAKKIFGKAGKALIGGENYKFIDIKPKGELLDQLAKTTAIAKTVSMVESRTPKAPPSINRPTSPANINPNKSSPVIQTPATTSDMSSVNYYLERFGFKPTQSEMTK